MAATNRNRPTKAASSESTYSVMDFVKDFPDDATCLDWLWRRLLSEDGSHAECPKCEIIRKFHRVASRPSYSCDVCGHHLHPTAGTIFHKSPTSLHLWFHAIFLMASTRCGISAKQLEREIGVTYKTAWRMFHRIREMLMDPTDDRFDGEIEIDEMYVGGRRKQNMGRRPAPKKAVLGIVERGGRVSATVIPDASAWTLQPRVLKRVTHTATVFTDEWGGYKHLQRAGLTHHRIKHVEGVFVRGDVHTQTIENFWSLVKRGIDGVYHSVSAKYLQDYLDEYCYRYNHRDDARPMFLGLLDRIAKYPSVA